MPLFGRAKPAPPRLAVLRADGRRIDVTARDFNAKLAAARQPWQSDAWGYRDMIGELRFAMQLLARAVARVRFYPAELREGGEDPLPLEGDDHNLDKAVAAAAVENFARLPMSAEPDGFTARLAENLALVGEAWVHGTGSGDEEEWRVRSVDEIRIGTDGRIMVIDAPGATMIGHQEEVSARDDLLRCWRPHPRYALLADAPLRAMLDVCEDVVLTGREQRAASRSRIASNGILVVPNEMSLPPVVRADDEIVEGDLFMADFTQAMIASITNEGDAGAVVPIVIRGPAEAAKGIQHIRLDREEAAKLTDRQKAALARLATGLDLPAEMLTGLASVNHWTAWLLESANVRHHVEPLAMILGAALGRAFLHPAVKAVTGAGPEQLRRLIVHADAQELVENPNRGQDARDAHDRGAISDKSFRRDLGYDDEDAPDDEELRRRIAMKAGVSTDVAALVLEMARQTQQQPREIINLPSERVRSLPVAEDDQPRPAAQGRPQPERPIPEPPRGLVADAQSTGQWTVDEDTARRLADIDRALTERILTAADAALARALERAGARVRSKAQGNRALAASLVGVHAAVVPARLGRAQVAALGLPERELLVDAFSTLRTQVRQWLLSAAGRVSQLVVRLLGLSERNEHGQRVKVRVETRLTGNVDRAVDALVAELEQVAERHLYTPVGVPEPRGEDPGTLVPPAVARRVLEVAGEREGMATGPAVRETLAEQGATPIGYEWRYGISRRSFEPHERLDGVRFIGWTEPELIARAADHKWIGAYYRPGDHQGCLCDYTVLWATPPPGQDYGALLGGQSPVDSDVSELAEADDKAGRTSTDAQRLRDARREILTLQARHVTDRRPR